MTNAYYFFYKQQKYFEINCYLEKVLHNVVPKPHYFQNYKNSVEKFKKLL